MDKLSKIYNKIENNKPYQFITTYAGPIGLYGFSSDLIYAYSLTGRADHALGGALLGTLAYGITDLINNKNKLSNSFNNLASKIVNHKVNLDQGKVIGAIGLTACAVLAGGEYINYIPKNEEDMKSPSYYKMMANIQPFFIASLMDFNIVDVAKKVLPKSIYDLLGEDKKRENTELENELQFHTTMKTQQYLSGFGSGYMISFAHNAGYETTVAAASLACSLSLVKMSHHIIKEKQTQTKIDSINKNITNTL